MIRRTPVTWLVLIALGVALVSTAILRSLRGHGVFPPVVTWVEWVAMVALAGVIFWLGWTVRAYQKGNKPNLDPIRAARTFVLARAGALTGAILAGWYAGLVLDMLGLLRFGAQRHRAIMAAVAVGCAVVLAVASVIAERFCELPPSEPQAPAKPKPKVQEPDPLPL